MIYQCYECRKLFNEDDGAMIFKEELHAVPFPFNETILAFKCKNE